MGNFIVYKHTSPSGKCYVGITSQAPECRWGNDGCKYLEIHTFQERLGGVKSMFKEHMKMPSD